MLQQRGKGATSWSSFSFFEKRFLSNSTELWLKTPKKMTQTEPMDFRVPEVLSKTWPWTLSGILSFCGLRKSWKTIPWTKSFTGTLSSSSQQCLASQLTGIWERKLQLMGSESHHSHRERKSKSKCTHIKVMTVRAGAKHHRRPKP